MKTLVCWDISRISEHIQLPDQMFLRARQIRQLSYSKYNAQLAGNRVLKPLSPPSIEQDKILKKIQEGHNVVVDAIAGSGKTSTILHIGNYCLNKKVLVLTYNAKLKVETQERLKQCGLGPSIEIHSYHSFGYNYYNHDCRTDVGIEDIIRTCMSPEIKSIPHYDIIVLDEAQDITRDLFEFFLKIASDKPASVSPTQLVMFGDRYQSIYQFKGSDQRYLTRIEKLMKNNTFFAPQWFRMRMSTSFRVSENMKQFVNQIMIRDNLIHSVKAPGPAVQYLIGSNFSAVNWIVKKVEALHEGGIAYEDMIVLLPKTKNLNRQHCAVSLLNKLSRNGVLLHAQNEEKSYTAEEVAGKMQFTTYHQSKGIERKVVIVFQFDQGYFDFYAKGTDSSECSNVLYVACTRATEHLILVGETYKGGHLAFLDRAKLDTLHGSAVEIVQLTKSFEKKPAKKDDKTATEDKPPAATPISLTTLVSRVPAVVEHWCVSQLTKTCISPAVHSLALPTTAQFAVRGSTDKYTEDVSELINIAVPAMFESEYHPTAVLARVENEITSMKDTCDPLVYRFLTKCLANFTDQVDKPTTIDHFLKLACIHSTAVTGCTNKFNQIKHYKFVDSVTVDSALYYLRKVVTSTQNTAANPVFKVPLSGTSEKYTNITVEGNLDIVTDTTIFQIKCVAELTPTHFLQAAVYAWLWRKENPTETRDFRLVNVKTGEQWAISADRGVLNEIVDKVVQSYLYPAQDCRDEQTFIAQSQRTIMKYLK